MGLRDYLAKRRFTKTPEPKGSVRSSARKKLAFVVQKHHASRLHYDFRLELDGVLKSWAVPKGPSLNPHDHHLAIMVEDHPFEYRNFEGIIPEGNYGAGSVIIWDKGTYEPRADTKDPLKTLRQELKDGHLTIMLHGEKLQGEFALIRTHQAKNSWLLIKKGDDFASEEDVTLKDQSVVSGKRVDDERAGIVLEHLPKRPMPKTVRPMLTTLVDEPFSKAGWLFEIKWDGYRAIGTKKGTEIELYSRNGLDFSTRYTPVTEALRRLPHDVVLDGEVVVVDSDGTPHFEDLQQWQHTRQGALRYYAFDILWCDGHNTLDLPLIERKKLLKEILPESDIIHYSDHIASDGKELYAKAKTKGLEGIIAKRADSAYAPGVRSTEWLKIKTHLRQEVVIGGFTEPRGSRKYLGALILGVYEKGELMYVGHSGGGIPDDQRKKIRAMLDKLERKQSSFAVEPKPNAPVHWVRPEIVCEVSFSEWTQEGRMRHPEFEGLRPDKQAKEVHKEKPNNSAPPAAKAMKHSTAKGLELTHLDKVFWPELGYTKGDLLEYYQTVAQTMLPYLKNRPHSLLRHPNGIKGESFFQKDMPHVPDWVQTKAIYSESNKKEIHYLVCKDVQTLLYMVQLGSIEINPWNSRIEHLDNPDWIVIDLDPEGVSFEDVITVTQTVHAVCEEWKIPAYPKTSGKTGIHVYIPLGAAYTYEQAKQFAQLIAIEVNKRQPKLTSVERMPQARKHKIYIDFLQNRHGQTLAAPYSVRPTKEASVSAPLHWDEVKQGLRPEQFTIKNMPKRLQTVGDIWKPVLGKGIDIAKILEHIPSDA